MSMTSAAPKPRAGEQRSSERALEELAVIETCDRALLIHSLPAYTALAAQNSDLTKALEICDKAIRGVIGDGPVRGNGTPYPIWADMISAAVQARALLAKHGR